MKADATWEKEQKRLQAVDQTLSSAKLMDTPRHLRVGGECTPWCAATSHPITLCPPTVPESKPDPSASSASLLSPGGGKPRCASVGGVSPVLRAPEHSPLRRPLNVNLLQLLRRRFGYTVRCSDCAGITVNLLVSLFQRMRCVGEAQAERRYHHLFEHGLVGRNALDELLVAEAKQLHASVR